MKPNGPVKLVSQLLDLPIVDAEGRYCGIVDDVELSGRAGQNLTIKALLVGPGAYSGRLPGWALGLIRLIAGDRITRVPWGKVKSLGSAVVLNVSGKSLDLQKSEDRAAGWIPHRGAF